MRTSHVSIVSRMSVALATAAIAVPALIGIAQAHERPGSTCAVSGMTMIHEGEAQVCLTNSSGKATWGKLVKTKKSPLTFTDTWVKAADSGMSAAFGVISNPTNKAIRVIGAQTAYSPTQLHEVVMKDGAMVMQQKQGGFVIPAGGSVELKPGGNHIMLMKLARPVTAGTMVPLTLVTADGGLLKATVMGKVFAGANETYNGSSSDSSMDMS